MINFCRGNLIGQIQARDLARRIWVQFDSDQLNVGCGADLFEFYDFINWKEIRILISDWWSRLNMAKPKPSILVGSPFVVTTGWGTNPKRQTDTTLCAPWSSNKSAQKTHQNLLWYMTNQPWAYSHTQCTVDDSICYASFSERQDLKLVFIEAF